MTFRFERNSENFIIFKNTLEGSLRKYPNIIFYVTSNYRHLIRYEVYNQNLEIHKKDTEDNLISLSDRHLFGWAFIASTKINF